MMLGAASVRLLWRPQNRTAALLGRARSPGDASPLDQRASAEALRIGRAVERVAAVLPWHPVCLPRAVATASMLRRRGIDCSAHLGVSSTTPPEAHAWVTVGNAVVQGAPVNHVTELASFV